MRNVLISPSPSLRLRSLSALPVCAEIAVGDDVT